MAGPREIGALFQFPNDSLLQANPEIDGIRKKASVSYTLGRNIEGCVPAKVNGLPARAAHLVGQVFRVRQAEPNTAATISCGRAEP